MPVSNRKGSIPSCINNTFILLFIILFFSTSGLYPQEDSTARLPVNAQAKILTLKDCLQIALENNHKIKASKHGVTISETQKKQAESAYWPQVSMNALCSYTDQPPIFTMPEFNVSLPPISLGGFNLTVPEFKIPEMNIKMMDRQNILATLMMTYPLYTGGKVSALNREAENGVEISRQEYKKSNLEIRYDVTRFYYAALLSRKLYKIGTDALERLDITLKLTESMYQNGSGKITKLDYLKNKVIVDQVRSVVNELKKNVKLSKDALTFTLGTQTDFDLPDEEIPFTAGGDTSAANFISQAYSGNPDWAKANAAQQYYQAKIDEAYSGHLPKFALVGSLALDYNSYNAGVVNKDNSQVWMIGLGAEMPIFNGFRTSNEVSEAEVQLKKFEEQRNLLHDGIALQVKEVINRINVASENIDNASKAMVSATESRSLHERAFQQEMVEAKDLIQSQIMESLMEAQYQKALYDHLEAEAYLNYLTGKEIDR